MSLTHDAQDTHISRSSPATAVDYSATVYKLMLPQHMIDISNGAGHWSAQAQKWQNHLFGSVSGCSLGWPLLPLALLRLAHSCGGAARDLPLRRRGCQ